MFSNDFLPNSGFKYYCINCDYGTCKKSSYTNHLLSSKHKKLSNGNVADRIINATTIFLIKT